MKSSRLFFAAFLGTIVAVLFINIMTLIQDPIVYYLLLGAIAFIVLIFVISEEKHNEKKKKTK